jgi:pimeloyl-ACP methyl ester carboxylesterase
MYGLTDSPIDLAAFALDHGDGTGQPGLVKRVLDSDLTRDDLLDNITLYWLTNSGVSASRYYWESKLGFFDAKDITIRSRSACSPTSSPGAAQLGEARLSEQPHPLQPARPRRPLRRLGAAAAVQPGDARLVPHAALTEGENMAFRIPTVVLVHGAFADASSWNGVIERLLAKGVQVTAPPNPLRGIAEDSAYTASYFAQAPGPVLAVGHSYGGAVITNAASEAKNVVGLVYVAAFAPDEGEALGEVTPTSKDSVLDSALVPLQYPVAGGGTATEFAIDPAKVHEAFAGDLSAEQAALIGVTQRPVAEAAFGERIGPPAWKRLRSWSVVATGDKAAGADLVRAHAQRAGATITEVEGSHVIMISQPQAVTDVIVEALAAVEASVGVG